MEDRDDSAKVDRKLKFQKYNRSIIKRESKYDLVSRFYFWR